MLAIAIAKLTLREMLRRRLFLVLVGLTLVVIALTTWGFSRLPTLADGRGRVMTQTEIVAVASQLLILVGFMFSFVLAFSAVFAGAPSLSGDVESGVALAVLARPISRAEFVIGKWLGIIATVVVYAVPTTTLQLLLVDRVVGYVPPHPLEFELFVIAEAVVILTLALALSTRLAGMVGGVSALILWGVAWLGGIVGGVGAVFENATITHVGTATKLLVPTDGLWRGAVWALEPASIIAAARAAGPAAAANPFFAFDAPPFPYLLWCAAWIAGVLGVAVWSFAHREL